MSATQDNNSHWRMRLNNILQENRALGVLKWEENPSHGHQPPWTAVVRINGVEYGSGQGNSKDAAKEAAAEVAYKEVVKKLKELQGK